MTKGRLIKGVGGFYYVDVQGTVYECKARGIFRKKKITPIVGDDVEISIVDSKKKTGVIEAINERKTELIRPTVANVDQAVIVFAVAQPEPHLSLLDRFLILAENQNLQIVVCFNKIDLVKADQYKKLVEIYQSAGYKVIVTSLKHKRGISQLKKLLEGKTTVLAGPSGVGKSTILNRIDPNLKLKTGKISAKIARGKHTTRHAELLSIHGKGWVVDTPGFSSLDIDFIEEEMLGSYFPEFEPHVEECKFASCLHIKEPKCGVKKAVENGKIYTSRYESYLQLIEELKNNRRY